MHAPPGGARFYRRSRGLRARTRASVRLLSPSLVLSPCVPPGEPRPAFRRRRDAFTRDAPTRCVRARSREPRDGTRPPIKTRRIACTRLPLSRGCLPFSASRHRSATTSDLSQVRQPFHSAPFVLADQTRLGPHPLVPVPSTILNPRFPREISVSPGSWGDSPRVWKREIDCLLIIEKGSGSLLSFELSSHQLFLELF